MKLLDKEILYLDNHLLIVNKPSLLLTLPEEGVLDSVQTRGQAWLKEHFKKPHNVFLHPVHRLDRVASGIVVCARTSKSLSRLNEQIRNREWKKRYLVRHEGALPADQGRLVHFLKKGDYRTTIDPSGDESTLYYTRLEAGKAEVELVTGRYHQIRIQFSAVQCPIRGDTKYGATTAAASPGIDLHHTQAEFLHPVTRNLLTIRSVVSNW